MATVLATDSGRKAPARLAGSAILAVQSDERLVKLARAGHNRAFDAIVQRYRKPLVGYCRRILPDSRCEDAVQTAFINAHAALLGSEEPVRLKPWLYAITRNAALNMLRQNGWNHEQIPLDFDGVPRPDQVLEQRIELQQTVAAMNELPERQRSALVMRELEGRSYDEIAVALGAGDGAVRQLLNRARVTLRSAASAFIPPPLVARVAASMPPSDGRRMAEVLGGLGAAGVAKAGATALVAGSLVVGAVEAPLPLRDSHKASHGQATLAPAQPRATTAPASERVVLHPRQAASHRRSGRHAVAAPTHRGPGHSGPSHSGAREDARHSGSDDTRGDDRSGSGGGSDDRSGTSGSDDSGSRSGSGSGSDDISAGAIDSGSGTSGSDTSGSGELPGTSGSGELSGTSGSGELSGTSGSGELSGTSGSSGSGSSGSSGTSGSDDTVDH